jgi:hypothetical protein
MMKTGMSDSPTFVPFVLEQSIPLRPCQRLFTLIIDACGVLLESRSPTYF